MGIWEKSVAGMLRHELEHVYCVEGALRTLVLLLRTWGSRSLSRNKLM